MAQQTAVEFLVNELESILELYNSEWDDVYKAAEKAKAMEKEQIKIAHNHGEYFAKYRDCLDDENGLKYYNETYGTKRLSN